MVLRVNVHSPLDGRSGFGQLTIEAEWLGRICCRHLSFEFHLRFGSEAEVCSRQTRTSRVSALMPHRLEREYLFAIARILSQYHAIEEPG